MADVRRAGFRTVRGQDARSRDVETRSMPAESAAMPDEPDAHAESSEQSLDPFNLPEQLTSGSEWWEDDPPVDGEGANPRAAASAVHGAAVACQIEREVHRPGFERCTRCDMWVQHGSFCCANCFAPHDAPAPDEPRLLRGIQTYAGPTVSPEHALSEIYARRSMIPRTSQARRVANPSRDKAARRSSARPSL